MDKKEFAAWSLIFVAILTGSLTASSIAGCRPKSTVNTDTDFMVDEGVVDSNMTATSETPLAMETPAAVMEPASMEPEIKATVAADVAETDTALSSVSSAANELLAKVDDPNVVVSAGGDWPQWGGTRLRNNVPNVTGLPETWKTGKFDRKTGQWDKTKALNIRWYGNLGSQTYGNPVIADGAVYVGTNNGAGHIARYPAKEDLGCLLCFDEQTGDLLWQHSSEKLITGRVHDWPLQGVCSAPLVEGERLWFVTSRGEVRCLDTKGFADREDDGPLKDEPAHVGDLAAAAASYKETLVALDAGTVSESLKQLLAAQGETTSGELAVKTVVAGKEWKITGSFATVDRTLTAKVIGPRLSLFKALSVADTNEADVIWVFNMMTTLGSSQHNMASCSVTAYGDLLFVNTSNGQDESHINLPAPNAPSFFCMNKNTAEVYWTDKSPGENILHGQWSSPAIGEIDGVPQVIFAGGDGIVYSFRADQGKGGSPELLWKFDANPKETIWILGGEGTRNNLIATPVIYDDLVYIAVGQDPEHGEGDGHLWCIDPTKRGDISTQLAMKVEGNERVPISHKRVQAVEPKLGEVAIDNPNSGAVWQYSYVDQNENGEPDFAEIMHRTIGTVAIKDDLLYVSDLSGVVHCLDAKGAGDGQPKLHFTYDMLAQSWGSPLIADGRVFFGDEDGDIAIFEFGSENKEPVEEINMGTSIYSTPVAANSTIFISTKDKLFAIGSDASSGGKE